MQNYTHIYLYNTIIMPLPILLQFYYQVYKIVRSYYLWYWSSKENLLILIKYISGFFLCSKCKARGSWDSLERVLQSKGKSSFRSEEISETPIKWISVSEKCEALRSLPQEKTEVVMSRFNFKVQFMKLVFIYFHEQYFYCIGNFMIVLQPLMLL